MNWLLGAAIVWYWWRLYSLSFNFQQFPDPRYAEAIWDKRSTYSNIICAAIIAAVLYDFGTIHRWWIAGITFAIATLIVGLVQPFLVGLIIVHRTACIMLRLRLGLKPHAPRLAPFAWTYYLTREERRQALEKSVAPKTSD